MPKYKSQEEKNRLQLRREELGLSVEEVSAMTKVAAPTVYRLESMKEVKLNSEYLIKFSNVLKIYPDYLIGLTDEKRPLTQPLFECDIHEKIIDKIRKNYLKPNQSIVNFSKDHSELPILYLRKNPNFDSLVKFVHFFHCSITELISISTKDKLKQMDKERQAVQTLINYF